ncbi:MAG TPA: signal peptidase I [Candidatus Saccharimonadales bacterium]|nr:signal peptidase I [Candidatus Saccharimonadales bacterium]
MQPQNPNPMPNVLPPKDPQTPRQPITDGEPSMGQALPPSQDTQSAPSTSPQLVQTQSAEAPATPNNPATPANEQPITTQLKPPSRLKGFLSFVLFIAGVLLTAFLINQFVFQSYFVDGTSMTPTLQNNDRLIIEKVSRSFNAVQGKAYIPERGQIVVLDSSLIGADGHEEQLIKRVIGLPGETVIIEDKIVTIKNAESPQGFNVDSALGLVLEPTYAPERIEVTVPENHVYVMGDNRVQNGSYDSRAFGPVAAEKLEGRLWSRVLPINQAQLFSAMPRLQPAH